MEHEVTLDKKYANKILILFASFIILVLYIETMLIPSLPSIATQYHVDAGEVSLVLSLYLVSGVALNPIVGKLGDIYGKKRVLKYILPIYAISVAVTGFSPNFTFLLVARTIQGIGLTVFPLMISLVQEEFPREMVPRAMALMVAMFGVGASIGLPIGSLVSNTFGWQATYHTALPFIVIISVLVIIFTRESRYTRPEVKIDYAGAIMLAIALACVVFALSEAAVYGVTSAIILGLIFVAIVFTIALLFYERRMVEPILDQKILKIKNVMTANILTLFAGLGFFFSYQAYAYLFESQAPLGFGFSIFQTGLAIVPFAIMNVIAAPILGRLIPKHGVKPFFIGGSIIAILGFLLAVYASSSILVIVSDALVGLGVSLVNVPTVNLLVLSIERKDMGLATSLNSVFRFMGSALGAPIAGVLIAESTTRTAFEFTFWLPVGMFVIVAIVSLFADEILGKNKKITKIEQEVSV